MVLRLVLLTLLGVGSVLSSPIPEHYHDHLGVGHFHNAIEDYYSKPKYAFGYEVDGLDEYFRELSHGRWEIRDGDVTQGQYRVLLPDGRIQIVSYVADKFGYRPTVKYVNKGVLPPPPPSYAHVKVPQFVAPVPEPVVADFHHIQEDPFHSPYATYGAGFGYGFDPFVALGSSNIGTTNHQGVAVPATAAAPGAVVKVVDPNYKKRALLYDRTLFRKDVERRKRKSSSSGERRLRRRQQRSREVVAGTAAPQLASVAPTPTPPTTTTNAFAKQRNVTPAAAYHTNKK